MITEDPPLQIYSSQESQAGTMKSARGKVEQINDSKSKENEDCWKLAADVEAQERTTTLDSLGRL